MQFRSAHIYYALCYVVITFIVLLLLNIYSSNISQELFYNSKEADLVEKCQITARKIANLEVMNPNAIADAVSDMNNLNLSRLIVTNQNAEILYDSADASSQANYAILPEVIDALGCNDVFNWTYKDGVMRSFAATPIMFRDVLVGVVYIAEYDTEQGELVQDLQRNILAISIILELVVIISSLSFSAVFSERLRKIMYSIRIIRSGDYTHKLRLKGNDELAELSNEFNDLTDKLQDSEQKRRQFVSDASHELKTPLASIKLLSDSILQNDMDATTVNEFVKDIGDEAERLNRMSQKLLTLSRTEGEVDSDSEIIYLTPTIQRVVRMLKGLADKHNIAIQQNLAEDQPILILEDDLYQIIFNLVENGIKYNQNGGTLSLKLHKENENILLSIQDTGMGIPEESLPYIFERFYRVDKARARRSGGSGLGLSIVKNMVERNNGEISVKSVFGVGSIFTLSFPIFDVGEVEQ